MRALAGFVLMFVLGAARAGDCPIDSDQVAKAGFDTAFLVLSTSRCADLHDLAAERIAAVADVDADPATRSFASLARVRVDLRHGRLADAEAHLLQAREQIAADDDEDPARVDAMLAALRGVAAPPVPTAAPDAPWILQFGWCGTPMVHYLMSARVSTSLADVQLATGHPEWAIQALLAEEWQVAMSMGVVPPRLRELADAAFGPGSYEREVESALAALRYQVMPGGEARADFPFFGLALPLPVGTKSWRQEQPTKFESAEQVRDYMRELFDRDVAGDEGLDADDFANAVESDRDAAERADPIE